MKTINKNQKIAGISLRTVNKLGGEKNLKKTTVLDDITWKIFKLTSATWQNVIETAFGDDEKNSENKGEKLNIANGTGMQNLHVSMLPKELSSGTSLYDYNSGGKVLKEESFHGGESVMFKTPSTNVINTKCFN